MMYPRPSPTRVANHSPQAESQAVTELPETHKAPQPAHAGSQASRRGFLRSLSVALAVVVAAPWRLAHAKKVGLALSKVAPLQQVGGSTIVKIKGQELLLIRDTETTVKALDPMCTHKKCKVFYRPKDNDIGCKCHKSKFTLEGARVSGPAPRPLGRFKAKIKGDKIIIDLG